ncbi:hypothetical protein BGX34_010493 [Mortierella sp. NVP85]|nr:hypothetical protein BGX34_010493 [Mortierella sp. NVP85]
MDGTNLSLTPGHFKAALRIVSSTLEQRLNQTAQTSLANGKQLRKHEHMSYPSEHGPNTARFNQLDLLRIGQDHVFIIHRELLLGDIRNYLKRSSKGLQRVFVNVDHHLPQPEVLPRNRYRVLEEYITDELLPEIQDRVECWDQADRPNRSLPTPNNVSMVTLTGWLLGYPVVYVFPLKSASRKRSTRLGLEAAGRKYRFQEQKQWDVPGEYLDDETEPEDNEDDSSLNCLANQILVVTKVHLEPSSKVEGLGNHCLTSFSYPFELAERWMDRTKVSPQSPCTTPLMPHSRDEGVEEDSSYNYDTADASDVEYPPSPETLLLNIKPAPMTSEVEVVRTLDGNMGSIINALQNTIVEEEDKKRRKEAVSSGPFTES